MSRSRNRCKLRRCQLLAEHPYCFYCGLGFPSEGNRSLVLEAPGWGRLWLRARPTLEHLHPRSRGGTTARVNTVLAHSWCNSLAAARSVPEKLALREQMRRAVRLLRAGEPDSGPVVVAGAVRDGWAVRPGTAILVHTDGAGVVRHLAIDGLLRLVVESVQARPRPGQAGVAAAQ